MKPGLNKFSSITGLAFDAGTLSAVEIIHHQGKLETRGVLCESFSQNILTGNPELVGAEIRKLFEKTGIRETRCVACLPLSWVYCLELELPTGLTSLDAEGYVKLQAERAFPFNLEDMILSIFRFNTKEGKERATIAAVPAQRIEALQKVFREARLQLKSVTLGISSLASHIGANSDMALVFHNEGVDVGIFPEGAPLLMRSFTDCVYDETQGSRIVTETLIRELRITLGSLPSKTGKNIKSLSLYGEPLPKEILTDKVTRNFSQLGITAKKGKEIIQGDNASFSISLYASAASINYLSGKSSCFEFLPPSMSRIKKIMGRVSARHFLWLAISLSAIFLSSLLALLVQRQYLATLERKWNIMAPDVSEVEAIQDKLKKYRPWHDESIPSLSLLKELTGAFPVKGDVWLKALEIRNHSDVQFTGEARNNKVWLDTLSKIRKIPSVEDLKVLQIKETEGLVQFSVKFVWKGAS